MRSKTTFKALHTCLLLFVMLFSAFVRSQTCSGNMVKVTIANIVKTNNSIEYDIMLNNTSANTINLAACSGDVVYNSGMIPTGSTVTYSLVDSPANSDFPGFSGLSLTHVAATFQLRWSTQFPASQETSVNLPPNTEMKFCRFRVASSLAFTSNFQGKFTLWPTAGSYLPCQATVYCAQPGNALNPSTGNLTVSLGTLSLGGPYNFTLNGAANSCATSGSAGNLNPVSCFGGNNGSATITLSPAPSNTAVTYTVDGGSSVAATVTSGSFAVGNLTAGSHSIVVSNTSCPNITIPVTITGPSALTNTTTQTACGSYLWSVTGATYNSSGTYSGTTTNGNGCTVNETLNLTITSGTTTGSVTTTACGSYTWPVNGVTYTTSGVRTVTSGCNTATLDLTITPVTTTGSVTATACGSYTWPVNGVTYTTTGVRTVESGCNTATLDLTITPVTTTGSVTTTACGSYTWPVNGITYTTSGVRTVTSGCNTATLDLTITPVTTTGSVTTTACGSYTWPVNGVTYTTSGVRTVTSDCNTATLDLTITPITTTGSVTTTACGSYTWPANGVTYTTSGIRTVNLGCNTATLDLTITPVTTTGSVTTTACGSYTWPVNGVTYTTSGVRTVTSDCNTATLDLTITPITTTGSVTTTACGSYTWPVNGVTYTTSGVRTVESGCNTATLDLTITPFTTTGSVTTTACGSYRWPVNGVTYTTSGVRTVTSGCNTATLDLTITPLTTTGSVTTTTCGSYTWPVNGVTYTTSGVRTVTSDCNTATLDLTITPMTANGSVTITACDSYTWPANGVTYTTSGIRTVNSGCNTATLDLTINNNSAHTTNVTACDSYTWSGALGSGMTYTQSGTYTKVTTNATGCQHTETLVLTINTSPIAFYADIDGDGFGAGAAIPSCAGQPAGTVSNNLDCNDNNANANLNHVEVQGNGIDDNCDGNIDEASPITSLIAAQCGFTMTNMTNQIYASEVPRATAYRFEVVNGGNVRVYDSAANSFTFANLVGGGTFATTYMVSVAIKVDGFWGAYSNACTVTTPAGYETTQIVASQCGTTLPLMATTIYANQVTIATQYRFEVSNGANVRTFDSPLNRFSLNDLSGSSAFATTYGIRVAMMIDGVWQPYGAACNITTPASPGFTSVNSPQCGSTISNTWATIYVSPIAGAQGYRFQVTNGAQTRFYDSAVPRFALRNLTGTISPSTAYTIRVAVLYNNVYQPFGSSCVINTAAAITREPATAIEAFVVKASPNPFATSFRLEMNTTSEAQVEVKVYDMIGKLVEARQIGVAEFGSLEIGYGYPSGVYNMIVTQGENVKTLRVIKR